jgi:hypothetical protein
MKRPPEAPSEGKNENLLKCLRANFLMVEGSKRWVFVSWMQKIAHELSSIFALIALHLSTEFNPLIFQFLLELLSMGIVFVGQIFIPVIPDTVG